MDYFADPKLTISETDSDINDFVAICEQTLANGEVRRVIEYEPKTGNKIHKLIFGSTPPNKVRHLASTALKNLRLSLDQACCSAYTAISGKEAPFSVEFPVASGPKDLDARIERAFPVGAFPPEIRAAIRKFDAYHAGNGHQSGNEVICTLSKTSRKVHRIVCSVGLRWARINMKNFVATDSVWVGMPPVFDPIKNEMVLGITKPAGNINVQGQIASFVSFNNTGVVDGQSAEVLLRRFHTACADIVGSIEAETIKLIGSKNAA